MPENHSREVQKIQNYTVYFSEILCYTVSCMCRDGICVHRERGFCMDSQRVPADCAAAGAAAQAVQTEQAAAAGSRQQTA